MTEVFLEFGIGTEISPPTDAHGPFASKLEVDVNPPAGSGFEYSYLDFPLDFEIRHQDLPSNLALKIHALLCRPYLKGRDWYDLAWYARKKVRPNLSHLQAALEQYGPWKGQVLEVTPAWVVRALPDKIESIDWKEAARDVERFLSAAERQSLSLWSERSSRPRLSSCSGSRRANRGTTVITGVLLDRVA